MDGAGPGPAREGRGGRSLASATCRSPGDAVLTARPSEVSGGTTGNIRDAVPTLSSLDSPAPGETYSSAHRKPLVASGGALPRPNAWGSG